MMRALRLFTFLAVIGVFVQSSAGAGEKFPQPNPGRKAAPTAGTRHLFINKTAIAERTEARRKALPSRENPNAGRGFLLEKVQGGHGTDRLSMTKLRHRQLEGYRRREIASTAPADLAGERKAQTNGTSVKEEPGGGYSAIACAFGALAAAVFVVSLRRRGRRVVEKKKARRF